MFRIQWIPHGFHLFIQNFFKKLSQRVTLEFLNRKLDIVDPGIELTTANYMSLPEQANNIQKKQFHPYLETLNRSRDNFKTLAKLMISQEPNVLLGETWNLEFQIEEAFYERMGTKMHKRVQTYTLSSLCQRKFLQQNFHPPKQIKNKN